MPDAPDPQPTAQHHAHLSSFLKALAHIGEAAVLVAPAVIDPFIKNPGAQSTFNEFSPASTSVAEALSILRSK